MSDTRRRSHRHRHGGAPSNSSSTSLHRGGDRDRDRDRDRDDREPRSSSHRHRAASAHDPGHRHRSPRDSSSRAAATGPSSSSSSSSSSSAPQAHHPIYGHAVGGAGGSLGSSLGRLDAASASRYSLTDQFAATRSVLDFGFDDAASSIFDDDDDEDEDARSVYSVSTVRGGGNATLPSAAAAAPWDDDEDDDNGLFSDGSAHGSSSSRLDETVPVGYSAVLEQEAAAAAAAAAAATASARPRTPDDDDDDGELTDRELTPKRQTTAVVRSGAGPATAPDPTTTTPAAVVDEPLLLALDDPLGPSADASGPAGPAGPVSLLPPPPPPPPVPRTHYDVLCLARVQQPPPRPAQIRAAYFRLARLLNSSTCNSSGGSNSSNSCARANRMPASLRPLAAVCFARVQEAFETLVEPARRRAYDRYLDALEAEASASESESESEGEAETETETETGTRAKLSFVHTTLAENVDAAAAAADDDDDNDDTLQASTDLGVRYSCAPGAGAAVLDYAVTHTVQAGLPALGRTTDAGLHRLLRGRERDEAAHAQPRRRLCGTPVVRLAASTYALAATDSAAPLLLPALADRFQPLLPEVLGPARLAQLARTRASGCVVLGYRQAFFAPPWEAPQDTPAAPIVVDIATEVLPRVAVTARVARAVPLRLPAAVRACERAWFASAAEESPVVNVEVMVQQQQQQQPSPTTGSGAAAALPRLGLGLSRRLGRGVAFLCADSGNHAWWRAAYAAPSAAAAPAVVHASSLFAPLLAPMVEVGYTLGSDSDDDDGLLGLRAGRRWTQPLTGPADRGLKGVEADLDAAVASPTRRLGSRRARSSWTVSAAVAGGASVATYVRYGRTVFLTPLGRGLVQSSSVAAAKPRRAKHARHHAVRVEAELCAADWLARGDGYLAVRALAPVRWWALAARPQPPLPRQTPVPGASSPPRLGVELAISPGSGCLHVSLYWSHLRQRLKLPLLFFPASSGRPSTAVLLWAAAAAAALVARELAPACLRATSRAWRTWRQSSSGPAGPDVAVAVEAVDEEEELAVSRHRAEADELAMVLAAAVDAQRAVLKALDASRAPIDEAAPDDGLVIVSAKYGVAALGHGDDADLEKVPGRTRHRRHGSGTSHLTTRHGWVPDYEVADVTAALSALVIDASRLHIPGGLRKGHLLGFWDPAPHYRRKQRRSQQPGKKVLHVRYRWHGKEHTAEVGEHEELRLP